MLQAALCLLAFSLPTWYIFTSISLGLVLALWLWQGRYHETWVNLKTRKALWPWFVLYTFLIASSFYSQDTAQSQFDLKSKLSYLILPIIVGAGIDIFDSKTIERIFLALILGVTFTGIISLAHATTVWYPEKYFFAFFYHQLVSIVNPNAVYTAWYTIFCIALLLFMPWKHFFKGHFKVFRILLILFLLIFFILLSARMFILLFLLFIIPYFIKKSFSTVRRGVIVTIMTIGLVYWVYDIIQHSNNPIKHRYNDIINRDTKLAWLDDYSDIPESRFDNVTLRLFLWRISLESIAEKNAWLTGVGNGDVHLELTRKMKQYRVQNITSPDESKRPGFSNANLHNMYLQQLVMTGLPGLFTLLLITIPPLFFIRKVRPYQPFLVFNITSILFMMQEAVLQTQAGIIFYIFISCIFWNLYYSRKQVNNTPI